MPELIPELAGTEISASLTFYQTLGFAVVYERPEDGFARVRLGTAEIMLDRLGLGCDPEPLSPADRPFGRGVNIQIEVAVLAPVLEALVRLDIPPRTGPETRWYRAGAVEIGQRQLWVDDPDGYLLRFFEMIGPSPAEAPNAL